MGRFTGLLGLASMLGLAYLFSTNRKAIRLKTVLWGLGLQLAFAFFVPVPDITAKMILLIVSGHEVTGRAHWIAESLLGALLPAIFLWGGGWLSQLGSSMNLGHGYVDFAGYLRS